MRSTQGVGRQVVLVEHILMRAIIIGCIIGILHSSSGLIEMDSFVMGSMEMMILVSSNVQLRDMARNSALCTGTK